MVRAAGAGEAAVLHLFPGEFFMQPDQIYDIGGSQLGINPFFIGADGGHPDVEDIGNFQVAFASGHEAEDLVFAG